MKIKIREYTANDAEFVASSWLKSNKGSQLSHFYSNDIYAIHQQSIILKLLEGNAKISVACLPEDEDCILGFVCWQELDEKKIIHYIYTKFVNTRHGVAKQLLNTVGVKKTVYCTHLPKTDLLKKLKKKFVIKRLPINIFI